MERENCGKKGQLVGQWEAIDGKIVGEERGKKGAKGLDLAERKSWAVWPYDR